MKKKKICVFCVHQRPKRWTNPYPELTLNYFDHVILSEAKNLLAGSETLRYRSGRQSYEEKP